MPEVLNVEIKATTNKKEILRDILSNNGAIFKGTDHQKDTYYKCPIGRLKYREGNIERSLIFYERKNQKGPKDSNILLEKPEKDSVLKDILAKVLAPLVIVDKVREIYFIDNVKFHLDEVKNLGSFVEIEAISENGQFTKDFLNKQCHYFMGILDIQEKDLVTKSYSDLLLQ